MNQLTLEIIAPNELERYRLEQHEHQLRLFDDRRYVPCALDLPPQMRSSHAKEFASRSHKMAC